jgi:hypothetical protein
MPEKRVQAAERRRMPVLRSISYQRHSTTADKSFCALQALQIVEFMAAHGLNKDGDDTYHPASIVL